ncbi:MAG: hypothetical protein QW267_05880 [Sulfolobales archaeon]
MKNVYELSYKYVVPSIKRVLTLELLKKGFAEVEVAKLLGISKSLATRYVKGERGSILALHEHQQVKDLIRRLADKIASGTMNKYEVEFEVMKISASLLSSRYLCKYHKQLEPELKSIKCNICSTIFASKMVEHDYC